MDNLQNFNNGLNSDISPVYQPQGTYVDALNIELIDDELQGSVAISNSKGNKFQVAIPDVSAIVKLTFNTASVATNITINGETGSGLNIDNILDLYNYITTDVAYTLLNTEYSVYYDSLSIFLYPKTGFSVTVSATPTGVTLDSAYVPASTNLQVIGYGIIRDDIYLFTTPCKDIDPQVNGGGYGYIWKLTYNNITFAPASASISLVYGADLGFSTYWHIPQTAIVGRYENSNTQRLYWTDNYNKFRSINVIDPQLGATDPTIIDVAPAVDFDIPLLIDINSGAGTTPILIGNYQVSYRLKNVSGATTNFSVPSNMVQVVDAAEELQTGGLLWKDYHGDIEGTTTTKRITWKINSLDRDFDTIEVVVLIRENKNDVASIYSFYESSIIGDSIEVVLDGDILNSTNTLAITLEEFQALTGIFTHCKTIGTKDNRLIVGNIRTEDSDLDYDARAYRHKALNSFDIIENGLVVNYPTADYTSVADDSDAINPFNLLDTDTDYDVTSKYKADGATLGGEGTNISYEFVSIAVAMDFDSEMNSNPQALPIVHTNPDYTTTSLDLNVFSSDKNNLDILQEYPIAFPSPINDGMKYPQMNSIYLGYQNNEIYRIGIQFYDKSKNPYFVKWIGDIKMPDYFDTCPAANHLWEDGTPTGLYTDYRKSFTVATGVHGANESYACQLGLKLNITIPDELTNKIEGYSIVRVKREDSDKTVVAEGIVTNFLTYLGATPNFYYIPVGDMAYNTAAVAGNTVDLSKPCFITPNILDSSLVIPTTGMKFRCSSYLTPSNALQNVNIQGGIGFDKCKILKMYDQTSITYFERDIDFAALAGLNATVTNASNNYNNITFPIPNKQANGNPCYIFELDSATPGVITGTNKYLVYIYNPIINQYGGATYINRSNNEYILCSHFRSVKTSYIDYTDSPLIFGGDVTNSLMDEERISKDWSLLPDTLNSTTFFYPSSSPVNRELRHGRHPNISLTDIPVGTNDRTDYFYNTAYSCQNDIVLFIPKPVPFISNTIYDNRFYASEIKINGELSDSWSIYKANNYWDVEGDKGPINSMLSLRDKMYFWQDRAFGIIEINPRTMITDTNNSANAQVNVGTGLPLQRHDYISTTVGTKHQTSTISSSSSLFWFDVNTKKIYMSSGQSADPFSDVKGLYSFLDKNLTGEIQNIDKPTYKSFLLGINGIAATYDYKKHKAIFTFHSSISIPVTEQYTQTSFTVVINELKQAFTTKHSFTPRIYINDYKYFFSTNNQLSNESGLNDVYLHDKGIYGEYYGVIYDSYIKFISNPNPQFTKVFDNLTWDSQATSYDTSNNTYTNYNDDTWNTIRVTNDYQNTDTQTLILNTNIKRKERTWMLAIPRNRVLYTSSNSPNIYTDLSATAKPFAERIRDKYIQIELTYNNDNNRELKTNSVNSIYRVSPR